MMEPEGWGEPKRILIILAHPDDPEFFCGATIARWTDAGHEVMYCLLTRGDKGARERDVDPGELINRRDAEQRAAAAELAVHSIHFLDIPDGCLVATLELRREIVRLIRQARPDVVVTSDPTNYFPSDVYINHPDHRAAGQAALEAVFPGAGNPLYYPEFYIEGLEPHPVREVWVTLTHQPNVVLDVTGTWERKIAALHHHVSQIGDPAGLDERMRGRRTSDSTPEAPRYEEKFRRLILG